MSLLQILYTDHKFFKSVTQANPSVDNRLCTTPQKRCEYVLKTYWKLVYKNSITWWYVLKAFWRHLCKTSWRRLQNVSKASWRCLKSWRRLENVLKTSWKCLEDVFARRLEEVLKKFWRRLGKTSWRRLEDVLKTFLQDVLKTFWRHFVRRLEDVLKTYDQDEYIDLDQDVLKTKTKDVFMTSSRRLHQDECLLGYYHKRKYQLFMLIFWETVS